MIKHEPISAPIRTEYYVKRINGYLCESIQSILLAGDALIEAKEQCDHGAFLKMFADSKDRSTQYVHLSIRSGQFLMKIAKSAAIRANASVLPANIKLLNQIAGLPDKQASKLIKSGVITDATTSKEIRNIIASAAPNAKPGSYLPDPEGQAVLTEVSSAAISEGEHSDAGHDRIRSALVELQNPRGSKRKPKRSAKYPKGNDGYLIGSSKYSVLLIDAGLLKKYLSDGSWGGVEEAAPVLKELMAQDCLCFFYARQNDLSDAVHTMCVALGGFDGNLIIAGVTDQSGLLSAVDHAVVLISKFGGGKGKFTVPTSLLTADVFFEAIDQYSGGPKLALVGDCGLQIPAHWDVTNDLQGVESNLIHLTKIEAAE